MVTSILFFSNNVQTTTRKSNISSLDLIDFYKVTSLVSTVIVFVPGSGL